jgi:hypothetical protein
MSATVHVAQTHLTACTTRTSTPTRHACVRTHAAGVTQECANNHGVQHARCQSHTPDGIATS